MILIHKRVEELAKQADEYLLEKVQEENRSSWAQVFAELIVRECIDIVEQDMKLAHIQMIPLTLEKYANGRLKEKIREHFGVGE